MSAAEFAVGPSSQDDARRLSWLLVGMAGLVLLIACADAAGLLLLRAERRRREIGVRLALGASRRQVGRQLFVESLLLAILAGGAGILFAVWATQLLALAVPEEFALPMGAATSALDSRALAFAIGAAGLAALFSGIVPALRGPRVDVLSSIKGESRRIARVAFGDLLVACQIALSVVLLVGAGLTARTLAREAAVNPGFDPSGKLEASLDLARQGYDRTRGRAFLAALLERASAMPGVRAAVLARTVPVQSSGMRTTIDSDSYTPAPGEVAAADLNIVTPGYFHALGASLVAGRDFDARDRADGPAVAIVSESMARKFWPGLNAVGRRIMNLGPPGVGGEVIGVVRDVRTRSLRREADPTVYVPLAQFYMPRMTILLTTDGDPAALRRPLSRVVAGLDPNLPLFHVRTLEEKIGASMGQGRLIALLVGAFAGLGLLLSATGLYGVVSYATQARTREFGIRLALGAQASNVRGLVLSRGASLAIFGLAAGLAAAAALSRLASQFLYGVTALDPLSYAAAAAILGAAVLIASAAPAGRAAKVDPIRALRSE
jgi:predicted permease